MRDFLMRLREVWRGNVAETPHLGRTKEIDQERGINMDLAKVLSMDGMSSNYSVRHLTGRHYLDTSSSS